MQIQMIDQDDESRNRPNTDKRPLSKKSNKDLYKFNGLNNMEVFQAQMQVSSEADDSIMLEGRELGFDKVEAVRTSREDLRKIRFDMNDKNEDKQPADLGSTAGRNYFNNAAKKNVNFI